MADETQAKSWADGPTTATAMPRAEAARDVLLIRSPKRVTDLVISYPFSVSSLADEMTSIQVGGCAQTTGIGTAIRRREIHCRCPADVIIHGVFSVFTTTWPMN
jgi:hypothetical protein